MEAIVSPEVEKLIREALDERGKLPCPDAWRIARDNDVSVLAIGDWANANGVRICSCALGCFP